MAEMPGFNIHANGVSVILVVREGSRVREDAERRCCLSAGKRGAVARGEMVCRRSGRGVLRRL